MNAAIEIALVVLLIAANGIFAMAEIALVASKKARLKNLADAGKAGAKVALELADSPNQFLATVQVGITLVGILAGAFGGDVLAERLSPHLRQIPWIEPYAHGVSLGIVVVIITYLSLVMGELIPKRLGLNNPEGVSIALSRPMALLSKVTAPLVNILSGSTDRLLKLVGFRLRESPPVSEEEIRTMVEQGFHAGVVHNIERDMVEGVFRLDELTARDLMTPRARIVWLNLDDPDEVNWRKIVASGHSHFPVYQGTRDQVQGMVAVKSLWANKALAETAELKSLLTEPLYVVPSVSATKLLQTFKDSRKHIALVTDEYGGVEGLVTLIDILEAVVGAIPSRERPQRSKIVAREDGSWLCDGLLEIDELKTRIGVKQLPGEEDDEFQTLAGFALHQFGRIPKESDSFEFNGYKFEIVDLDRHRIDKVLIVPKK
jgi:putative hemolysin